MTSILVTNGGRKHPHNRCYVILLPTAFGSEYLSSLGGYQFELNQYMRLRATVHWHSAFVIR